MPSETSQKGYVSVVQSIVTFSKAHNDPEDQPKKPKQRCQWFSGYVENCLQTSDTGQPLIRGEQQQNKPAKYKEKFDPRVTARYDIKALIGRGSFSHVMRVEHRATRQPFAIKMMEVEAPESHGVCASELAVLQRVSHANVIQLIEVFQFPRRVYMVLELATGGELMDRIVSRGHFTEWDAIQALRMVLAAVGYLHTLGITHRDLKPENLLYYHPGADSKLLVTDFGLSNFGRQGCEAAEDLNGADRSWFLRTTCGTPEYLAPEVLMKRPYSCAVDMWALGVIAYIVLSGSMPFEDDSRTRLYRSILMGKYSFHGEPWSSVSSQAKDFIRCLLVLDPSTRLTADQAMHHPWVVTMVASSSMKNLHQCISQNFRQRLSRASSRCPSSTVSSDGGSNREEKRKTQEHPKRQQKTSGLM
ncbi:serine/threonine-protein kinase H1 homolog [Thalassophryne amazonica]|uniref:serine/threonine-protein kinase H1 homolog n=1 Tax=Thalassophryne amazonica TaxID=390379 RepID=UPI001471EDCF|nr:serine/threonine-protein kinase H1 homolog [Thalassophryne amazonica]